MTRSQLGATVLLAVVVLVGLSVPVLGLTGEAPTADASNTSNGTGVQVAAYMQASAAQANASVDTGLFLAELNNTDNPGEAIRERATELSNRLERLENQSAAVSKANGSLPAVVYNAQAAGVNARIGALNHAINETEQTAKRVGVNVSQLDRLRNRAANLTGPEVAAIARNLTMGGPPEGVPGGPPSGVPGAGANGSQGPGQAGPPNATSGNGSASTPTDTGSGNTPTDAGKGQTPTDTGSGTAPTDTGNPGAKPN